MTTSTRHQPPTVSELTWRELGDLAVRLGRLTSDQVTKLVGDLHNDGLIRSRLEQVLRSDLHRLSGEGELTLCTRTHRNSPNGCPSHGVRWSTGR